MLTRAYGHILLSLGISCIKRRKHIHGKLDLHCGSCKPWFCHTQRRKAHLYEVTFPELINVLAPQTWEPKATRMGNSFGKVQSASLGQSDSVGSVLRTGCLAVSAVWSWNDSRRLEVGRGVFGQLLPQIPPPPFFFRFQAGLPKYIILYDHNTKIWRSLGTDFMFCISVTGIQRMMLSPPIYFFMSWAPRRSRKPSTSIRGEHRLRSPSLTFWVCYLLTGSP